MLSELFSDKFYANSITEGIPHELFITYTRSGYLSIACNASFKSSNLDRITLVSTQIDSL